MKRDWDLLRWILDQVVSCPSSYPVTLTNGAMYGGPHYALDIGERKFEEVYEHIMLLGNSGLAEVRNLGRTQAGPAGVAIDRLTMAGHTFLEAARDETRWQQAMKTVNGKGGAVKDLLDDLQRPLVQTTKFVDPEIIEQLRLEKNSKFDLSKVICFCEELNSSFSAGNYLASALLLRALINHIPPIFGHTTFHQVVSQVSKTRRELFKPLDEVARDVADLHTHDLIRHKEISPTRNQLEPFKPSLEFLLQEILVELHKEY